MQNVAPTALAGSIFAATTSMIAAMDFGMLVFVYAVVLVAVVCGIASYIIAMQQAKNEIVKAFEEHIQSARSNHVKFLQKYDKPKDRRK